MVFGRDLGAEWALGVVGGALAVGTFLATAIGTRLRIHRPTAIQSSSMIIVAGVAVLAVIQFSLLMVALLCLVAALVSGIAKLAVDASIQERIPERLRASSFAHSETVLMLAFVAGGGLGLVPFDGRMGIAVAAGVGVLAAIRGVLAAARLRGEKLAGRPLGDDELTEDEPADEPGDPAPTSPAPAQTSSPQYDDPSLAPPGYHIYRPSSAVGGPGGGADDETRRESPGSLS